MKGLLTLFLIVAPQRVYAQHFDENFTTYKVNKGGPALNHRNITFVDVLGYRLITFGGPTGVLGADSVIYLNLPNAQAFLSFYAEGTAVPPNKREILPSGKPVFYVNYRYSQLQNIVSFFRTNKQVKFYFDDVSMEGHVSNVEVAMGDGK